LNSIPASVWARQADADWGWASLPALRRPGVRADTIAEIAASAGVSVETIYAAFRNRSSAACRHMTLLGLL
jgi:DNA-binding phage protein